MWEKRRLAMHLLLSCHEEQTAMPSNDNNKGWYFAMRFSLPQAFSALWNPAIELSEFHGRVNLKKT